MAAQDRIDQLKPITGFSPLVGIKALAAWLMANSSFPPGAFQSLGRD